MGKILKGMMLEGNMTQQALHTDPEALLKQTPIELSEK